MITAPDTTPQFNFPVQNLPKDTSAFYDSKAFAENELKVLGTAIQLMQQGFEQGLNQIKQAIEGQS